MIDQGFGFDSPVQQTEEDTFVEVCYAKSIAEAATICKLLETYAIAALVETDPTLRNECGVAVLVQADRLVEASEILTLDGRSDDVGTVADLGSEPDLLDLDSSDLEANSDDDDDDDEDDDLAIDLFEDRPDF